MELIERHERTGRPLGTERFIAQLERALGRVLRRRKPGPKAEAGKSGKAKLAAGKRR